MTRSPWIIYRTHPELVTAMRALRRSARARVSAAVLSELRVHGLVEGTPPRLTEPAVTILKECEDD